MYRCPQTQEDLGRAWHPVADIQVVLENRTWESERLVLRGAVRTRGILLPGTDMTPGPVFLICLGCGPHELCFPN